MRIRLYALAKELGVANKDLVEKCKAMGLDVKSHSSTIGEDQAQAVRASYGKTAPAAPAVPAPEVAEPAPKPKEPAKAKEPPKPSRPPRSSRAPRRGGPPKAGGPPKPGGPAKPPAGPEAKPKGPNRGPRERETHQAAEIVRRIELPTEDTKVRAYGPHVRIKERRGPSGGRRRPRRPTRSRRPGRGGRRSFSAIAVVRPTKVTVDFPVTLRSLSHATGVKVNELMRSLVSNGIMFAMNDPLDDETVSFLAAETEIEITIRRDRDLESELAANQAAPDKPEDLKPRAPVVAFLGHVDHGKTSLLDAIRETHVVDGEAGGITQHIGAYAIERKGQKVVFLDTPGHEAFTAMRARGAQVTDIVVLVVAAEDGVMPQTEEAINHARAAGVAIVVAVNKMDLPGANPQRVMEQFSRLGLLPAKWGGDIEFVEVSAVTRNGIDDLIEVLAIQAEILELKANPDKPASGVVLEAKLSEGRGAVATILVQDGTLHVGDIVLCGTAYGRARSIQDHRGRTLEAAGPATPVEIAGLSGVPAAGDAVSAVADLDTAREITGNRQRREREASFAERHHVTLENLFDTLDGTVRSEVRVILKADVQGSLEVIRKSLNDLSTDEVGVQILHAAVGGVNDSDILLADASDAVVIGFNVVPEPSARTLAEEKKIDVHLYNVIYNVTDDMKAALEKRLAPEKRQHTLGHASVRRIFRVSRAGNIAGCYVTDGKIVRNSLARLIRDNVVIYDGKIESLRHIKDDVREVPNGMECGIRIAGYNDVKEGDVIEAYEIEEIRRRL